MTLLSFRGWSIIKEKVSISDFVDLDSIIEKMCKLRSGRFISNSKYVEIMFSLCKKGKLNLLKPLLQDLEDKNLQDKYKYTLLHSAAEHGQLNIVEYLVPLLVDKNPKAGPEKYGGLVIHAEMTPLQLAARKGHLSVIEFMVPHLNGDINTAKDTSNTDRLEQKIRLYSSKFL